MDQDSDTPCTLLLPLLLLLLLLYLHWHWHCCLIRLPCLILSLSHLSYCYSQTRIEMHGVGARAEEISTTDGWYGFGFGCVIGVREEDEAPGFINCCSSCVREREGTHCFNTRRGAVACSNYISNCTSVQCAFAGCMYE